MTDARELKPCPFCGGKPTILKSMGQIICSGEECFGPATTSTNMEDSISQWNTRSAPPSAGTLEELQSERRLFDEDLADKQRTLDRIAELIGLPHDQEIDATAFELWFDGLSARRLPGTDALVTALEHIRDMPFSMVNDSESLRHTIRTIQSSATATLKESQR